MGSDSKQEPSETSKTKLPKLSLLSIPVKPLHDDEPMDAPLTPPLQTSISIPFQWEDSPGKPKQHHLISNEPQQHTNTTTPNNSNNSNTTKSLDLPPRLLHDHAKFPNTASPTTVLDGPYVGRSPSNAFSFRKIGGSFRSPNSWSKREIKEALISGGSTRWGTTKVKKDYFGGNRLDSFGHEDGDNIDLEKGTMPKSRGHSQTKSHSHLWASIYESFKQVVHWRRKIK